MDTVLEQEECAAALAGLEKQKLLRISRVYWQHEGRVTKDAGWLQLDTALGTLVLRNAPNGFGLAVQPGKWEDPFAGPLDQELADFVAEKGRPRLFDVTTKPPFSVLVGQEILAAQPLYNKNRHMVAVEIVFRTGLLIAMVDWDELHVSVLDNPLVV